MEPVKNNLITGDMSYTVTDCTMLEMDAQSKVGFKFLLRIFQVHTLFIKICYSQNMRDPESNTSNGEHLDTAATPYVCSTLLGFDKHNAAIK